jgi:hypothetical protein
VPHYLFLDRRILIGNITSRRWGKNGRGGYTFSTGKNLTGGCKFLFLMMFSSSVSLADGHLAEL